MHIFIKLITILLLPITLTACARAQGALAPTGVIPLENSYQIPVADFDDNFLPDVEPASLAPIINYVDGLNLALTGEFLYLKSTALTGCGCLVIADRLKSLLSHASLIGGGYQLKSIKLEKDGLNQKSFQVKVIRSDIRKMEHASGASIIWSGSEIKNTFVVKRVGDIWLIKDTK